MIPTEYTALTNGARNTVCAEEAAHRFTLVGEPYQKKSDEGLVYPNRRQALYCERCGETIEIISGSEMFVDD